ncbi:hypothetical protein CLV98_10397 [Dyadobacter jejuensis]|uniref:Uncharacterized protein n=1 Tax=Dyadobacter jejuensis TaxID=1082580 RepID=A0A316AME3_9BACT|nr:hypothetical protein [Dyadobacter jejuensis]PWJ58731.1 hypothetical protein CLV98_10397 [Dyadobacter jejuensis]
MTYFESFKTWFLGLGEQYQVDPLFFGAIYVGAIPFFFASMAWLIRRIKQKKSIVLPLLLSGFFFISAYLYLIVVGRNIPLWVYLFIAAMVIYGVYSNWLRIRRMKP